MRMRVCVSAMVLFLLAACGGGGSGGGGGSAALPPPAPIYWGSSPSSNPPATPLVGGGSNVVRTTNPGDVFTGSLVNETLTPANTATMTGDRVNSSYYGIRKTPDGLQLSLTSNLSRSANLSISGGDFSTFQIGGDTYVAGVKESTGRFPDNPGVSYKARDTVILGGKGVGLQYADFGIWDSYERLVEDGQAPDGGGTMESLVAFVMESPSGSHNRAGFSGDGTRRFTGKTMAAVRSSFGSVDVGFASGDAALALNLTGGSGSGDLTLIFDNYYTFNIANLGINSSGAIASGTGTTTSITGINNLGTSKDINGSTDSLNSVVSGQFYGPSAVNPTEAAGQYKIDAVRPGGGGVTVTGAFGVK